MKYVDLGLPSGTLWSERVVASRIQAKDSFQFGLLPTMDQLYELFENCQILCKTSGYILQSKINANYIY